MIASGPIDIEEYLGLCAPRLPRMCKIGEMVARSSTAPPELVKGVLHEGCKMVLAGSSKTNKTWSLVDLAMSVASGAPWWGRETTRAEVLFANFELPEWAMVKRVEAICRARPEVSGYAEWLTFWHLRGHSADMTALRPELERELEERRFGLIVLDPAYKLLGDRDENANGDITSLMNEFEKLCVRTGAAIVFAHHFAKGDVTLKVAIDRMSGAGAWARDPDVIMSLTPHEEVFCYSVAVTVRNLPQVADFVMAWEYPLMVPAPELDPAMLATRRGVKRAMTEEEFVKLAFPGGQVRTAAEVARSMEELGLHRTTSYRYVKRASRSGRLEAVGGAYRPARGLVN